MKISEETNTLFKSNGIKLKSGMESETLFQELILNLPAAIYTCDKEGRILFYNQSAAQLWGREPIIGTDFWCGSMRIYKTDGSLLPLETCPMAIALKEERSVMGEEIVVERPDGIKKYVLPHPQPIFNTEGELIGAYNMLLDITAQREAQNALLESEKKFRELADFIPQIIWTAKPDGYVDYYNLQWYKYSGHKEGHGDASWIPHLHPDDVQICINKWKFSVKKEKPFKMELELKNPETIINTSGFLEEQCL